jgi:methionyl-tRNA formyltransferase
VIVPVGVLNQLGYGAYNFHPGPPQYPGWAPAHFALYERATEFGGTVHHMIEQVDAGAIVDVELFAIPDGVSVNGLEEQAYTTLVQMFWRLAGTLAKQEAPLAPLATLWGPHRHSRRAYQDICDIPLTIAPEELDHRLKVFGTDHFGIVPSIGLHGFRFRAIPPAVDAETVDA